MKFPRKNEIEPRKKEEPREGTYTRRQALQLFGAAAVGAVTAPLLAGCSQDTQTQPEEPVVSNTSRSAVSTPAPIIPQVDQSDASNMYTVLNGLTFIDQDGTEVDLAKLQRDLKDGPTTLTMGYAGCTKFCPMTNMRLGELGKSNPDLTSVVISVDQKDGFDDSGNASQENRDKYMKTIRDEGVTHNIRILYPKDYQGTIATLEDRLQGAAVDKVYHDTTIHVYAPGGKQIANKNGNDPLGDFTNLGQTLHSR